VKTTPYTGYVVDVYRCVYDAGGNLLSRTYENHSTYAKRDKVILYNPLDSGPWGEGTAQPPAVTTPAPTPNPTPAPPPEPTREPPAVTKQAAMAYIGQSAASLAAALGQPLSKDYAPSCMGSGEDGEWSYPGFTVYTYREGGSETVVDVI